MRIAIPIVIAISIGFLRCADSDEGVPSCSNECDSLGVYADACQSAGVIKENLYAIAYTQQTADDWWIAIADTVRMREGVAAWMPYVCNNLPDSLKVVGTEFLVDIVDKTTPSSEGGLITAVDLLSARLLTGHLEDDPRNGYGVGTADIVLSGWLGSYGNYIIRNQQEWDLFSLQYGAEMRQEVDFNTHTLIGIKRSIGGCWPGGHFPYRELLHTGAGTYKLKVTTKIYGLCQVAHITWQWVTVSKIDAADSLEIELEDVYIEESGE